jgi:hypothetical protein
MYLSMASFSWKIRGIEMCRSHWWAKLPATAGSWEDCYAIRTVGIKGEGKRSRALANRTSRPTHEPQCDRPLASNCKFGCRFRPDHPSCPREHPLSRAGTIITHLQMGTALPPPLCSHPSTACDAIASDDTKPLVTRLGFMPVKVLLILDGHMGSGVAAPLFQIYIVKVQKVACVIKHPLACSPSSGIYHQASYDHPDLYICLHVWEVLPVISPGQIICFRSVNCFKLVLAPWVTTSCLREKGSPSIWPGFLRAYTVRRNILMTVVLNFFEIYISFCFRYSLIWSEIEEEHRIYSYVHLILTDLVYRTWP